MSGMPAPPPPPVTPAQIQELNKNALARVREAISRKRQVDHKLAMLECSIYAFEGSYLADTAQTGGNIIKGFDNYMKSQPANKKRPEVYDHDRLFSMSSASCNLSMNLMAEYEAKQLSQQHRQSSLLSSTLQPQNQSLPPHLMLQQSQLMQQQQLQLQQQQQMAMSGGGYSDKKRKREREESVMSGEGGGHGGSRKRRDRGEDD